MSEVMEKPAPVVEQKKSAVILVEARLGLAEQKRQDWVVDANEGTTVEEILDPMYWAHVAARFQPMDRIEVRKETGEWVLDLIVTRAGRNYAHVQLLAKHDLTGGEEAPKASVKHRAEYKGTIKKWCVIRVADSAILQDGFQTRELAAEWQANHEKVVPG